ncbi:transcriptional regulator,crp/fnr family [Sporocytophaga myxococcoides]|uniref:Transcriptional regulator,crp/fnr family n=1 Tax=Sporocytophaga myxococcoides TaxID=153721 RepID=A0A098LFF4_9BACT|nr:Crp/Fnr family transcriptional regulator [Sporocytophaga myxococcoides]GAL85720.1 transcriptional regulator,crp/fnr family [Sporocytophaga myxococcoides]
MPISSLLKYISKTVSLSEEDIKVLMRVFNYDIFKKGSLLEAENSVAQNLYFIKSGFARIYHFEDGNEITTSIGTPNSLITSFESFLKGTPSSSNLKCITDCEMLYISRVDYDRIFVEIPSWEKFCRFNYEKIIANNFQRSNDLISLPAEKRYHKLVQSHPEIIQNVPIQYIASYIGIKPESLSRIRKKIS